MHEPADLKNGQTVPERPEKIGQEHESGKNGEGDEEVCQKLNDDVTLQDAHDLQWKPLNSESMEK